MQERERALPVDHVPADEEFNLRAITDAHLRVKASNLGILERHIFIEADTIGMPTFDHEGPRRGYEFVTRKITSTVAQIKLGLANELRLGNLDAKRDWGYAKEYVEAMWLMLQQEKPDDYVIATNETHSIREFLDVAFEHAGMDWKKYVEIDERYYRPAEVDLLIGDPSKAKRQLGWEPKTKFVDLVKLMVDADIKLLKDHREGRVRVSS